MSIGENLIKTDVYERPSYKKVLLPVAVALGIGIAGFFVLSSYPPYSNPQNSSQLNVELRTSHPIKSLDVIVVE